MPESELRKLDEQLSGQDSQRWDRFYQERTRACPFLVDSPDENLAHWIQNGRVLPGGRALDLGCGNARNAVFMAQSGFSVEALDYSQRAIEWARDRVSASGAAVTLICQDFFELNLDADRYDLIYDSGCFHHIAPHRRMQYVDRVVQALSPKGFFGLTCFRPEGGSGFSDDEVYVRRSLGGGLGYSELRLRQIWSHRLEICELRQMRRQVQETGLFGESFLWVMLAQKLTSNSD